MIKIKKLTEDAIIPHRSREGDACYDLYTNRDWEVKAYDTVVIPTGIAIELSVEYEAEIRPRSGISLNGVRAYDSFMGRMDDFKCTIIQGTIDSNYRGEIGIIFRNETMCDIKIKKNTKLAQMKINHVPGVKFVEVEELSESNRGENGFGSSGI